MGGIVGRLFREFAVTLSVAIAVSMVISLTATPMMCAHLLKEHGEHGWLYRTSERGFRLAVSICYGRTLKCRAAAFVRHPAWFCWPRSRLNVYLFIRVPKGFFPQQDNGRIERRRFMADQDTSFQSMDKILRQYGGHRRAATRRWIRSTGSRAAAAAAALPITARMFISLKPLEERNITVDQVIARLRPKLARIPGATLFLQASQDMRVGGRQSNAQYQFTMRGDNVNDLNDLRPRCWTS